jgi:hypothetical protein
MDDAGSAVVSPSSVYESQGTGRSSTNRTLQVVCAAALFVVCLLLLLTASQQAQGDAGLEDGPFHQKQQQH